MPIALPKTIRNLITNIPLCGVLVVPFVLQTVGAVALVGYLSYRSGQASVTALGHQLVTETNERVTQELKTYLQAPTLINRLNVDAVNQGQIDPQNIPALESALFNRLQQFESVTAVLFASPQGIFRAVQRVPAFYLVVNDLPRPDKMLVYLLNSQGKREQLIYTETGLSTQRDRPWYKRAVATGQPGWNSISQYGSFDLLTLNASQPVYDRTTKRLLGVFAVHIRLDYLNDFLNRLAISRSGQVLIVDQSGALVATSTGEQPYQLGAGAGFKRQFKQLNMDQSQVDLTRSLGEYLRDRPGTFAQNQPQSLEFRYKDELQDVKITPFRDQSGLNWRIVTVIPQSHFMAAIQNNTRTTVLLCLLTLGSAIALGLLTANRILARCAQFNQVSRELAAGNLDQRLPTDSPISELNSLAQTFNQMADELQQSFDRINTALAESEEKFTIIFRSSPDLIALTTLAEGRCVEANDSFFEVLEYSREALIGQRLIDFGIWGDRSERDRFRELLQQKGQVHNLEVHSQTRTGQIKTLLVSAELIEINGETYVLGIGRDISDRARLERDRHQTEAALQASETRFRELAETVREGFFVYETETAQYLYVNPAYKAINGTSSQSTYQGMAHWLNNIHPDDRNRIEAALQRERQGENFDQEYRYIRPNGEQCWLRSQAFPIRNETGDVVRVVGTVEDISDRKQLEKALRTSEAQFRNAFDGAPIGVSLVSPTGQFLKANARYCNLTGYTEAELLALTFQDITHPADLEADLQGLRQMLAGETRSHQMKKRYITKQGTIVPVLISAAPILDPSGQVLYFVGHVEDIRDRLKVERMKDEFISVVSHELRTPLTSIRGAIGILESGIFNDRPEKAQHMLQIALNNSDRLVRLVNDILDLERLESGKVELVMESCQVESLIRQAVDGVQAIADQSAITLSVTSLSSTLRAAPDAIIQALINLLSNAIKFSASGDTIWLTAKLMNGEAETQNISYGDATRTKLPSSILFSITDQGRGIPADKLELIFEQFQQVDVSDSREKGGTGLGLAICKNIVQQHGGQIWVESTLGKGSTFYFTLPVSL